MKGSSIFRNFLFAVALAAVVAVIFAQGCNTRLLETTASKAGHNAQTTIMDERAKQEALKTEARAATLPDKIASRRLLIWGGAALLLLGGVVVVALLAMWGWHRLHTHKPGPDGQYPILVRNSFWAFLSRLFGKPKEPDVLDLNQVPAAGWNPADKISDEERQRIKEAAQKTQFAIGITHGGATLNPTQALGVAISQGLQNRLAPPRDIREIPPVQGAEMVGQIVEGQAKMLEDGRYD